MIASSLPLAIHTNNHLPTYNPNPETIIIYKKITPTCLDFNPPIAIAFLVLRYEAKSSTLHIKAKPKNPWGTLERDTKKKRKKT